MATMKKDAFNKSLGRLDALAKGQLYHTSGDSEPGTWAGSAPESEDSMSDSIDDNGTDYNGVKKSLAAKVAKSQALTPAEVAIVKGQNPMTLIGQKLAKGQKLTPAESWAVKGGFDKFMVKGEGGAKEQAPGNAASSEMHAAHDTGEDEAEANPHSSGGVEKSFDKSVEKSSTLQKGLEMSPLLVEFARAIGAGFEGATATVNKSLVDTLGPVLARINAVEKSLAAMRGEQAEFNKSFAEAVVGIGHQVAGTAELAQATASQPAGAPKSQLRAVSGGQGVNVIQKSFGGFDSSDVSLQKSQIVSVMADMVMKGKISATEVIKYESTGSISPATEGAVRAWVAGNGQ